MEERRNAIVEFVNQNGQISFQQLKDAFPEVSEMTLRTDLKALDQERRIIRVHGGAKSVDVAIGTDDRMGRRMVRCAQEKQLIARKAVGLLRPDTSIYLDSGSTTTALARMISDQPYLIVTSGLSCALELAHLSQPKVLLPGGTMNRYSMSISGSQAVKELQGMHFHTLFLGVSAYSEQAGFTCGSQEECMLKQAVLERAERVIVLMDSSKVGLTSTFSICNVEDVDVIVSDGQLPHDLRTQWENQQVVVL